MSEAINPSGDIKVKGRLLAAFFIVGLITLTTIGRGKYLLLNNIYKLEPNRSQVDSLSGLSNK